MAALPSLLLAAGVAALMAMTLYDSRRDAWERAGEAGRNLVQAIEHDLSSDIRLIDLTLQTTLDMLDRAEGMVQSPRFQPELLEALIASAHYLDAVLLLDGKGDVLFDSRGDRGKAVHNMGDRDYFTALRDTPASGLYVSRPYRSRLTGDALSIGFSRRWSRADGGFAGVVLGVIRVAALKELFERIQLDARSSITLLRDDGCVLMRSPFNEEQIGRDLSKGPAIPKMMASPSGQFTAVAAIDGEERLYSHRRLEGVPAVINVALSVREIYAAWWRKAVIVGLATLALAGATVAMTLALLGELARRRAAEQTARESEATFRLLAENSSDAVARIDLDGLCRYVSPASEQVLGRRPETMVGRSIVEGVLPDDLPTLRDAMASLRGGTRSVTVAYRIARPDGRPDWIEATARTVASESTGHPESVVVVARDISKRKRLEEELAVAARTDGLTGLANRRSFDEALDHAWMRARRTSAPLSLLLIDIDRFKLFNDAYGHPAGDACLRRVAATMAGLARRPGDLAARYGGEEMAVILPDTDEAGAVELAERLRSAIQGLDLEHAHNPPSGVVTVSIGVAATVPPDGDRLEPATLVAAADGALYAAKHAGRNRVMLSTAVPPSPVASLVPEDEASRLVAFERYRDAGLTGPGDPELDRISSLAARAFGTPVALVTLAGRDSLTFAGRTGMPSDGMPRTASFCAHILAGADDSLVVPNATADFRFAGNPLVTEPPGVRFYAGVPLICPETKKRLGALCVIDYKARPAFAESQLVRLRQFADLAARSLASRARVPETGPPAGGAYAAAMVCANRTQGTQTS
ncbi:diguanylate cyclase domain-containing protein [Azospirillum agricola]|uniref:diguanylate cyclase domain-containing protein n=1 Tax=Azospirillum agricola TaxID=1720247 RepID=UPI000A0F2C4E|nr:diguanylate cyclase [Azospirillum agricola]SMH60581.1 PAS domain S-box-containing protein/diguanylate cyclase (GGDEF) domain-containing protein [Azospirillum lipoferum]